MVTAVSKVIVPVDDQEHAKEFWTHRIGFQVTRDETYGEERWIELSPPAYPTSCPTRRCSSTARTSRPRSSRIRTAPATRLVSGIEGCYQSGRRNAAMGLSGYRVSASVAVSDMGQAAEFYEGKLGLSAARIQADESKIYACGGDTSLHVYPSSAHAGQATATLATWHVADLKEVVDELRSSGVTFERYDNPSLRADANGIHELDDGRVAWFKDPDGNTFALEE